MLLGSLNEAGENEGCNFVGLVELKKLLNNNSIFYQEQLVHCGHEQSLQPLSLRVNPTQ